MANSRLIFNNVWDAATLTQSAGTFETHLPISNTQKYNNSRVFRTSDTQDVEILFDWDEPVFIEALALWRHNLTSSAQIQLQFYNGVNQTGDVIYDSGILLGDVPKNLGDLVWGKDPLGVSTYTGWETATRSFWFDDTHVVSSARLTISNPDNPDGYLEIGRIYAGEAFSPTFNVDLGHIFKWETDVKSNPTAGGTVHTLDAATYRKLSFNLSHLSPSDRTSFADLTRILSIHKDFFISLRPNVGGAIERDYSFAAKFEEIPSLKAEASRYETQCKIREV
ncbi:hypothetical protein KIH87_03370 [Paraneptunicella aestuarii]|uniref:hypothetical protein n=1 Tax=Paraneptunicella aestuarii TaxID=2831148 RepID=UPI001E517B60|nr:hypothetical protein [Paraneptunicella aestuarii]UAA39411.1 hypothetical protein KIH87_03370 [Paraneptunicella aestuarii]